MSALGCLGMLGAVLSASGVRFETSRPFPRPTGPLVRGIAARRGRPRRGTVRTATSTAHACPSKASSLGRHAHRPDGVHGVHGVHGVQQPMSHRSCRAWWPLGPRVEQPKTPRGRGAGVEHGHLLRHGPSIRKRTGQPPAHSMHWSIAGSVNRPVHGNMPLTQHYRQTTVYWHTLRAALRAPLRAK